MQYKVNRGRSDTSALVNCYRILVVTWLSPLERCKTQAWRYDACVRVEVLYEFHKLLRPRLGHGDSVLRQNESRSWSLTLPVAFRVARRGDQQHTLSSRNPHSSSDVSCFCLSRLTSPRYPVSHLNPAFGHMHSTVAMARLSTPRRGGSSHERHTPLSAGRFRLWLGRAQPVLCIQGWIKEADMGFLLVRAGIRSGGCDPGGRFCNLLRPRCSSGDRAGKERCVAVPYNRQSALRKCPSIPASVRPWNGTVNAVGSPHKLSIHNIPRHWPRRSIEPTALLHLSVSIPAGADTRVSVSRPRERQQQQHHPCRADFGSVFALLLL